MKKWMILCLTVLCMMSLALATAETAEVKESVKPEPSAMLVSLVGGKTITAYQSGYGFGDGVETFTFNFRVIEPVVYTAADVEGLAVGSVIMANYSEYEAVEIQKDGDTIILKPKEEWLQPLKLSPAADGNGYNAETEGRVLTQDAYQFDCKFNPAFEYKAEDGTVLDPVTFMNKVSEGELNLDDVVLEATFDDSARLLSLTKK
ncbi:MAG: hypothetical protein IJ088_12855 [Clostridia bacterium]|nr:hypothetical protein [Clostridia bacterium]